jgi:hypothetical protein
LDATITLSFGMRPRTASRIPRSLSAHQTNQRAQMLDPLRMAGAEKAPAIAMPHATSAYPV